jgi:hypothetical protein
MQNYACCPTNRRCGHDINIRDARTHLFELVVGLGPLRVGHVTLRVVRLDLVATAQIDEGSVAI